MNPTGTPVSPRELIDIPDDVRATPAPAIPEFPEPYGLRTADPDGGDPELIAGWMSLPHLVRTWEQPWPADRYRSNIRALLAGTYSRPCILSFDFAAIDQPELGRRDVGYVELYRAAKDEIAGLYDADPHDVAFHIATGDPNLVGRGIMSAWIGHLAAGIWRAEPECRRLMGDPDHRNTPIRKALAKNGWLDLGDFDVRPDRRIALYTLPREPGDVPSIRH